MLAHRAADAVATVRADAAATARPAPPANPNVPFPHAHAHARGGSVHVPDPIVDAGAHGAVMHFLEAADHAFRAWLVAPIEAVIFFDLAFWTDAFELPAVVVWLAAGLVALLGLGLWLRVRGAASARRGGAGAPTGTWTALLGALEHQQPDVGEHFTAWVGERLGVPPASLVGEDVRAKLEAAGLPSTVAERTAVALNAFVRARYGAPVAPADVLDADLLEAIATATSGHHGPE